MTFDPGLICHGFGEEEYNFYKDFPETVAVWYDDPPLSNWLHKALEDGLIRIALDRDYVGRTRTGYVYRISGLGISDPYFGSKIEIISGLTEEDIERVIQDGFIAIRGSDGKLLMRYNPAENLIEIQRRGVKMSIDLKRYKESAASAAQMQGGAYG